MLYVACCMLYVYGCGYCFVMLLLYSISSGALGSPDLLLSYLTTSFALHITVILIIPPKSSSLHLQGGLDQAKIWI